jgi:hypothetical protein
MMNVEGMTRENVASHLQKYRLYLKKIGGHNEKDRVDADVLQALHEQNVQHMAAQQAMQHSMAAATGPAGVGAHHHNPHHPQHGGLGFMAGLHHAPQHQYTTAGGVDSLPIDPTAAAPMGAHPGVDVLQNISNTGGIGGSGDGGQPSGNTGGGIGSGGPPMMYIAPGDIVEGIPVSDIRVPEPVSPTVTAALEAGGKFNLQGWQYPPLPIPESHRQLHHPSSSIPKPSGAVMGLPHQQGGHGGNQCPQQQQQQHIQFNYHQQHHSNLGDLAAAAAGAVGEQAHELAPAVWTDNGEGWAEGWPINQEDEADADADGGAATRTTGNGILQTDGNVNGAGKREDLAGEKGFPGSGTRNTATKNGGSSGNDPSSNNNNNNNNNDNNNNAAAAAVEVDDDDDDDDDPPLIPGVPSAGELHHMVERVPMRMTDPA